MGVKITGNSEYLNCGDYEAIVVVDKFVPDAYIWIMAPVYMELTNHVGISTPINKTYAEKLKVIASPKNTKFAQQIVDIHNQIISSPLAKAMSETEE